MTIDKEELRRLAEAATKGKWTASGVNIDNQYASITAGICVIATIHNSVSMVNVMFGREPLEMWANAD